jgi:hypothetical protein
MSEVKLSPEELEDMLDRAARRGAKEALRSIGVILVSLSGQQQHVY